MKRFVWFPVTLCLLCVCCFASLLTASVAAAATPPLSSTPDQQVWVTNGPVDAIATAPDGTTYIGGYFTYVGPVTGHGVALDATSGARDTSFPLVEGTVYTAVADGAGGYYIGGGFTRVGGIVRNHIAHILADGSVDPAFHANANNTVYALAVSGSTVYVGGDFTSIGGKIRHRIAALDATSGAATTWNPNAGGGPFVYPGVVALAVSGSTVYAGGYFTSIGGKTRHYIAALDATTGAATAWNPDAQQGPVLALAVSGSTVYAGGGFTSIGGKTRNHIAALGASGAATAWDPNAHGRLPVYALAVSGSTVYAGGGFTSIGGQTRHAIAALDASSGLATAWDPNASGRPYGYTSSVVSAIAVSGSTVYAGGDFSSIGGQTRSAIAALDASSGLATAWDPNANNAVSTLAVSGSTVYAGGDFDSIGGQARNSIAALDASGAATAWNPDATSGDYRGFVYTLAVSGATIYVGGDFSSIGGQARNGLAALDASNGLATAWDPKANSGVVALAVSGSTVYVGGGFTSIGGLTRKRIAALDATSGAATAWNPNADGTVNALAVSGSTVYAGGRFTTIGGQARNSIAALDASSGAATAWNPNATYFAGNATVFALAVSGSTVYAGGNFTSIGGKTRHYIAALDASSGLATAWNPNANNFVDALAISGSTVYAGGGFHSIGGLTRNHIAALGASGAATAWNPNPRGPTYTDAADYFEPPAVYAVAVSGSTVYVGGVFASIGGQQRSHLARFSPTTGPWIDSLAPARGTVGATVTISGGNFGATQGSVTFGRVAATVSSWSDTQVVCTVPATLAGVVRVVVTTSAALASPPTDFSVRPHIGSLLPSRGRVGITLTITGSGFGAHRGTAKVYFGSKAVTTYVSWSATKIKVKVPTLTKGAKSVTVKTAGGRSNAKTFTVI